MSYEQTPQNYSADRVLRLIQESGDKDTLWVRTLNLKNEGVSVILDMEACLKSLLRIVNPVRQQTLHGFYRASQIAMLSTSSVEGWIMSQLTETKVKHTSDITERGNKPPAMFGGKK
tara:strand:- start:447 stop:797 length:351 start_codon:yes stop_codon:yes gene_type:complete